MHTGKQTNTQQQQRQEETTIYLLYCTYLNTLENNILIFVLLMYISTEHYFSFRFPCAFLFCVCVAIHIRMDFLSIEFARMHETTLWKLHCWRCNTYTSIVFVRLTDTSRHCLPFFSYWCYCFCSNCCLYHCEFGCRHYCAFCDFVEIFHSTFSIHFNVGMWKQNDKMKTFSVRPLKLPFFYYLMTFLSSFCVCIFGVHTNRFPWCPSKCATHTHNKQITSALRIVQQLNISLDALKKNIIRFFIFFWSEYKQTNIKRHTGTVDRCNYCSLPSDSMIYTCRVKFWMNNSNAHCILIGWTFQHVGISHKYTFTNTLLFNFHTLIITTIAAHFEDSVWKSCVLHSCCGMHFMHLWFNGHKCTLHQLTNENFHSKPK